MFHIQNDGNVGIGTTAPGRTLFVSGDAGGTGAWNNDSHSSYKEDFEDVTVLDNILQLNIKEWQFKEEILPEDTNRHLSPFSEDFRNQFGLGDSDYHIQASDVAGVALKGVQEIARRVNLTNAPTSTSSLIIDSNGNFGIATNTPTNILTIGQGMGNAIADGWDVYSSEEYKTDITYLEEKDYDDILEEIEGINVATYRWKTDVVDDSYFESTASSTNLGIIAEEAPDRVLSNDGKSVSLYDYTTFAIAGVKAVKSELDELRATLEANGYLSDSAAEPEENTMSLSGLTIDVDGYTIIDKIRSKDIETENLKVKAEDATKSGITIYDSKTGEPYCLYVEYGVPSTKSGECNAVLEGSVEELAEEPVEETSTTTPDVITEPDDDTSSTTPDVIIEEPDDDISTTTPDIVIDESETVAEETSTSTVSVIIE